MAEVDLQIVSRSAALASGLKRYFTGEPCKLGHISERIVSDRTCAACRRLHRPARRLAYNSRHPEKNAARARRWREKNRQRYEELVRRSSARRKERDPDGQYLKEWRRENRDKVREQSLIDVRRRRARKFGAEGSHTSADLGDILKLQRNRCAYCRTKFGPATKQNLDHIIPLSRGGSDDRKNLQFLCKSCNSKKHAKNPMDFSREIGMLL